MPSRRTSLLPTAAMLLAALLSYFGAPRVASLAPLMQGGLEAMRMLDLSERLRTSRALSELKPLSAQALELAARLDHGTSALDSAIGAGNFLSAPAPALADSSLSYLPPRPQLLAPEFTGSLMGVLPGGIQSLNRPPPLLERASQLFTTPRFCGEGLALSRAPPVSLR